MIEVAKCPECGGDMRYHDAVMEVIATLPPSIEVSDPAHWSCSSCGHRVNIEIEEQNTMPAYFADLIDVELMPYQVEFLKMNHHKRLQLSTGRRGLSYFDKLWGRLFELYNTITMDPVAMHWLNEILLNSEQQLVDVLRKVSDIQLHGDPDGALTATNSVRIPLATIARKHNIPLTDGSRIKHDRVP